MRTKNLTARSLIALAVAFTGKTTFGMGDGTGVREAIDQRLSQYHEYGLFQGVALVAHEDELINERGFGFADVEWAIETTPQTKFYLASVGKTFTATIFMQLVDEGRLDLDRPVSEFLEELNRPFWSDVTPRHLLGHTSGLLRHSADDRVDLAHGAYSITERMDFVKKIDGLAFEPGSQYGYSSVGFTVRGAIVERLEGRRFEAVLHDRILKPLKLNDTGELGPRRVVPRLAQPYYWTLGEFERARPYNATAEYGGGNLYSTAQDVWRFIRGLRDGTLLSPSALETMFTPNEGEIGAAWWIRDDPSYPAEMGRVVWHRGASPGYKAQITFGEDDGHVIVLLCNIDESPRWEITRDIARILHGQEPGALTRPALFEVRDTLAESGVEAAATRCRALIDDGALDAAEAESMLNLCGHRLIRTGGINRIDEATAVFDLIARAFPWGANSQTSLAYAHLLNGRPDAARQRCLLALFDKSLQNVAQAVYSNSRFLACIVHSGLR